MVTKAFKRNKAQEQMEAEDQGPTAESVAAPRGTHDILPHERKYWDYVYENAATFLRGWHWQQLETPIFEDRVLFERSVGEDTDIVQKEMFEMKVRGKGAHYVLRPEGTASIVRAYIEHGMRSLPRPVKLFYMGPFFRYERPQAGRLRQFHQIGLEAFGSAAPITDVEVIYITHLLFQQLGLEDYTVKINSLGLPDERKEYVALLKSHYNRHKQKLCRDCRERLQKNPMRVLDCKEEKCQQVANTAPQLLDHLSDDSRKHFEYVLRVLEELKIPHQVDGSLVRGLDYYTHTVFEFVPTGGSAEGAPALAFASGGRYDRLVRELGGKDTPAVGLAIGVERLIERIKAEGIELTVTDHPRLFVAQLGDLAKVMALEVMRELREAGIPFAVTLDRDGMQAQLKQADRLKVSWALIIGQKEVLDKTVILRNMESGMQEVVSRESVVTELSKRLHTV